MKHSTYLSLLSFLCVFLNGETLQVFSEEFNSTTFRCPPFTSDGLEMYLVFKNNENKIYTCNNKTPCVNTTETYSAEFNNSGSYFKMNLSIFNLNQKRSIRAVRCVFFDGEKMSNYTDDVSFIGKPFFLHNNFC
ncbi:hypothetical protein Bpfe_001356 [Biomphalaria pfeifferi]|uniref:Uncharacterized protein n=1 Tax=Biomphalaria pfeifferi TaxID=112525 RepID=A0AAD8CBD2_BIOPF|nr:hypothetical protein Bpfe_001356 [Biomphalaria pfeifferi]